MADPDLLNDLDDLGSDAEGGGGPMAVEAYAQESSRAHTAIHAAASGPTAAVAMPGKRRRSWLSDAPGTDAAVAALAPDDTACGDNASGDEGDEDSADTASDGEESLKGDAAVAAALVAPEDAALRDELAALAATDASKSRRSSGDADVARAGDEPDMSWMSIARLRRTARFREHMARVTASLAGDACVDVSVLASADLADWPEYKTVLVCNHMCQCIDEEVSALFKYVASVFGRRFPEAEGVLSHAPDAFVRVARVIGNETDITRLAAQLGEIVNANILMVLTVAASTTSGRLLTGAELRSMTDACGEVEALAEARKTLLAFVASRMSVFAPNLSALLGTAVAASLLGLVGGLAPLSVMPACNIQVVGQQRRNTAGMGRFSVVQHIGVIQDSPLVQSAPTALRRRLARTLSGKIAIAARLDCYRQSTDGTYGAATLKELQDKLKKWQEPPPGRQKKPLPAPDEKKAKKRGGRQHRRRKERMGLTDVRKEANRMAFGTSSTEYGDMVMGNDVGMLGESGSGRVRVVRKQQRLVKRPQHAAGYAGSSGATGGAASSLAFTPAQGIELLNPDGKLEQMRRQTMQTGGYFSATGTFSMVPRK